MKYKTAVIQCGDFNQVIKRTGNTREWDAYRENAAAVSGALKRLGHEVVVLDDGFRLPGRLASLHPDLAWICSGGIQGHDPATHLPGLLEMLGIPYVGSRPLAAGLADHKAVAKDMAKLAGVPTPPSVVIRSGSFDHAGTLKLLPPFPLIVKPACGMCSYGVFKVSNAIELSGRVSELHARYGHDVLIESYVDGLDFAVCLLEQDGGVTALPIMRRFFTPAPVPIHPVTSSSPAIPTLMEAESALAVLQDSEKELLIDYALTMFRKLRLRHFARVDFRMGSDIQLIEVTHKPDLTPDGVFSRSAESAGIGYDELISRIASNAVLPAQSHSCDVVTFD